MAQASQNIASGPGATVRAAINAALAAAASGHAGSTVPAYAVAGMLHWRTDVPGGGVWTLYARDGSASVAIGTLNTSTHVWTPSGSLTGSLLLASGDLIKGGAGGTPTRFPVGLPYSALHVNGAGNDIEWRRTGWEKLVDDAVFTTVGSVDFTSIPSNVKALKLVGSLLASVNEQYAYVRFSRGGVFDEGANYSSTLTYGFLGGSPTGAVTSWNVINAGILAENMRHAGDFGGIFFELEFPDLQSGRYPVALFRTGAFCNGPGSAFYMSVAGMMVSRIGGPLDGVRLLSSAGNLSGRISCLALRG